MWEITGVRKERQFSMQAPMLSWFGRACSGPVRCVKIRDRSRQATTVNIGCCECRNGRTATRVFDCEL